MANYYPALLLLLLMPTSVWALRTATSSDVVVQHAVYNLPLPALHGINATNSVVMFTVKNISPIDQSVRITLENEGLSTTVINEGGVAGARTNMTASQASRVIVPFPAGANANRLAFLGGGGSCTPTGDGFCTVAPGKTFTVVQQMNCYYNSPALVCGWNFNDPVDPAIIKCDTNLGGWMRYTFSPLFEVKEDRGAITATVVSYLNPGGLQRCDNAIKIPLPSGPSTTIQMNGGRPF